MAEFFLLGDSHIAAISQGARVLGIDLAGDIGMMGPLWHQSQFTFRDGNFTFAANEVQQRYERALKAIGARSCADINLPFVLSVGYHTRAFFPVFTGCRVSQEDAREQFLSVAAARALVLPFRRAHIDAVAALCGMGKKVFVLVPPHRDLDYVLSFLINDIISAEMRAAGAIVLDTRDFALGPDHRLLPKYCSARAGDQAHGNALFGQEIIKRVQAH